MSQQMQEQKEFLHKISECTILFNIQLIDIQMRTQVVREGRDITLVGWGAQLSVMEQACLDAEKVSGSCIATKITYIMHSASHNISAYFLAWQASYC